MAENKKISTKIKDYQVKEKKARKELLEVIHSEIVDSKKPKEVHIVKADFVDLKSSKKTASKMVAEKMWGLNPEKDATVGKKQRIVKRIFTFAFIIFVVGVLIYTAYNDFFAPGGDRKLPEWSDFKALLHDSWYYLVFAMLCLLGGLLAKGSKLAIMCKKTTGKFHFKTCFETGIIGTYYNNITPLAVGGQPFEIYHLSKHGISGGTAASLPIAAYITNQLAFVSLGAISMLLYTNNILKLPSSLAVFTDAFLAMAMIGLICCSIMPLLVLLFCFMPKTCSKIVQFFMYIAGKLRLVRDPKKATIKTIKSIIQNAEGLKKLAKSPLVLLSSFVLSLIEHLLSTSIAFFSLLAFTFPGTTLYQGATPSFGILYLQVMQMCFLLFLSVSFIPTPGNSGAADLSFFNLFKQGLPAGFAFPAMAVWRFFSFYSAIIIGFVFANVKKRNDKKRQKQHTQNIQNNKQILKDNDVDNDKVSDALSNDVV